MRRCVQLLNSWRDAFAPAPATGMQSGWTRTNLHLIHTVQLWLCLNTFHPQQVHNINIYIRKYETLQYIRKVVSCAFSDRPHTSPPPGSNVLQHDYRFEFPSPLLQYYVNLFLAKTLLFPRDGITWSSFPNNTTLKMCLFTDRLAGRSQTHALPWCLLSHNLHYYDDLLTPSCDVDQLLQREPTCSPPPGLTVRRSHDKRHLNVLPGDWGLNEDLTRT